MGSLLSRHHADRPIPSSIVDPANEYIKRWNDDIDRAARHVCRMRAADPDDVAQEIRVRLFQLWLANDGDPPSGYVRITIRNTALNAIRDEQRASRHNLRGSFPLSLSSEISTPEEDLVARESRHRLDAWVKRLPPLLERTFDLLYRQGLSQRAAAAALGVTQPRVAQLHRSLLDLGREAIPAL